MEIDSPALTRPNGVTSGRPVLGECGMTPTTRATVQIRWLILRDMADVLRIDQQSFDHPWTEEDFLCCLRQRNCIRMVAEYEREIVGFMIYELHKSRLHILNFAVDDEFRSRSVGSQMVLRLVDNLSPQRRSEITLEVRERNLDGQMFFKKQGFRAVKVLKNFYDDTAEDAYLMRYRLGAKCWRCERVESECECVEGGAE